MAVTPRDIHGATVLLRHVDALAARIADVRQADDIEHVHKMRVASRRLRVALDLFGNVLPARKEKKWTRRISKVTGALGDARDLDVQIDFLRRFIKGLPEDRRRELRPGLARLLLRLRQNRQGVQVDVVNAMDRLERGHVTRAMQQTLRQMQVTGRTAGIASRSPDLQDEAKKLVTRRREQLLVFDPYVAQADQVEQHHEMRLAAKRLRYTLEAYRRLFADKLKPQVGLVKQVQTQLGDIHDADMWIESLPRFIEAERARFEAFFGHIRGFARLLPGIEHLRDDRMTARRTMHTQFADFWLTTMREDRWAGLADALEGPLANDGAEASTADDADEMTDE